MKRLLFALAIILPIAGAAVWVLWFSPWLSVELVKVQISDAPAIAGPLTVDEVTAVASVSTGTPLLRVDTAAVATRIEELPAVKSAEVSRSWPNELLIEVQRRQPVAQVASAGGYDIVDSGGVVIRTVPQTEDGVPVVVATGAGAEAAIEVARQLPQWLRPKVDVVEAGTRNDVRLQMRNGSVVYWGSASDPELKADVLKVLLEVKANYYDVSAPGTPATSDLPERPSLNPSMASSLAP